MNNASQRIINFYKNNSFRIGIILVFIVTLFLRIYAIDNKKTVTFDDPTSIYVSTLNNLFRGTDFKYNWADAYFKNGENYTAYELKKALFESRADLKNIFEDLVALHFTTIDTQHLNLYYSILRIWNSGLDYSNPKSMIIRGCSLNLIFFSFSFFFMYKLLNIIRPEKEFILLGLFFAFVTTGGISNSLLIRPYPMWETFFILVTYLYVRLYKSITKVSINISDSNKIRFIFSPKEYLIYIFSFALFLLSHYYSVIAVFLMAIILTL